MIGRLISIVAAGQIRAVNSNATRPMACDTSGPGLAGPSLRSTLFRKWSPGGLPVTWSA